MSDYMFVLESHLDATQNRVVNEIARIATDAGMNVWLTGGAMRDTLRGARILDLDFTVERDAMRIGKALAQSYRGKVLSEDPLRRGMELQLGAVRASVFNARTEKYSRPGGKPQIGKATIHEDLMRRDLTINAMALTLNRGSRGLLIDPANGQADLVNRELRSTNSYTLFDDPSRIFRMIRFKYVLGFEIAARTQSQIENALLDEYQKLVPVEALVAEIRALSSSENAVAGLEAFDALGLLTLISPALTGLNLNAAGLTRFEKLAHTVLPHDATGGWLAFLTVLMEKMTPKERGDVLRALHLPRAEADGLRKLPSEMKKLEAALKSAKITKPSHVYEALEGGRVDEILLVLYYSAHRIVQDRIRSYYQKYLPMAQEVTEEQVASTGVKPGTPKFEKAFRAMVAAHLNARPRKMPVPEPEVVATAPGPMAKAARK